MFRVEKGFAVILCSGRLSVGDNGNIDGDFSLLGAGHIGAGTTNRLEAFPQGENKIEMASLVSVPGNIDLGSSISLMSGNRLGSCFSVAASCWGFRILSGRLLLTIVMVTEGLLSRREHFAPVIKLFEYCRSFGST